MSACSRRGGENFTTDPTDLDLIRTAVLIAIIVGGYVYISTVMSKKKKGTSDVSSALRIETITTDLSKTVTLKAIVEFAKSNGYKIDMFDETQFKVLLSDSMTISSWGFFYPIEVKDDNNSTSVIVGIESQKNQIGPVVTQMY